MGQQPSKDELVYQRASNGDVEGIKALSAEGAGLEVIEFWNSVLNLLVSSLMNLFSWITFGYLVQWVDREGKTPLIVACTKPEPYNVAKALLELGANVNAYGPGLLSTLRVPMCRFGQLVDLSDMHIRVF